MRKVVMTLVFFSAIAFISSCMRGITPEQAANGKARCGKNYLR